MSLLLSRQLFTEKLAGLVNWLTEGRWQIVQTQSVDDLQAEIVQLEKTLSNAPTRPTPLHKTKPMEPISERQKIVDLAG